MTHTSDKKPVQTPRKNPKIAKEARMARERWRTAFKFNIDQYHQMHEFVLGRQWSEEEEDILVTNKKVPLTSNKLATLANYLLGEQQANTPQLQVVPMTSASEEVAELRELIVKDIAFSNDAQTVYQVAASQAFIGGFGAILLDTEYTHPTSWDQNIVNRWTRDATRCYWDTNAETINKVDGMLGGYETWMSRAKFRQLYGEKAEKSILGDNQIKAGKDEIALATDPSTTINPFSYADDQSICILHHFKREYEKDMLYKLSNGNSVTEDELKDLRKSSKEFSENLLINPMMGMQEPSMERRTEPEMMSQAEEEPTEEGVEQMDETPSIRRFGVLYDLETYEEIEVVAQKEIKKSKIMYYQIAGDYELDKTLSAAKDIPVIFVDNQSYYDKKGKQICRPFFADCVDTQRFINYLRTTSAYLLKIYRYDQFIGSKQNVIGADTARLWKDPQAIQGLLYYDESPTGIKPERLAPPELPVSLFSQYELATQDLYTSTGIYPTQMGDQGKEISGDAINARKQNGSIVTQIPLKSIDRAIGVNAAMINEMIPDVYDAERVVTLMTSDGMRPFTLNKQSDAYGTKIENDIRKGTFQVRLKPGPSMQGQKEQALQSLQMVLQADPALFNIMADLYADNLPLPNNIELRNRLKTLVPPEILEAGKSGKEMPRKPPQPSPEQQALMMEAQFKQKEIEIKEKELAMKAQAQQAENELERMKLDNERLKVATQLQEAEFKVMGENRRTESNEQIAHADNLVKILTHSPKMPESRV